MPAWVDNAKRAALTEFRQWTRVARNAKTEMEAAEALRWQLVAGDDDEALVAANQRFRDALKRYAMAYESAQRGMDDYLKLEHEHPLAVDTQGREHVGG